MPKDNCLHCHRCQNCGNTLTSTYGVSGEHTHSLTVTAQDMILWWDVNRGLERDSFCEAFIDKFEGKTITKG